jgi:transcriptional regulator
MYTPDAFERPLAVTAVFLGPHAYVSPRWYEDPRSNVPTWNYAAVHVHGTARRLDDPREVLALLADLTAEYERGAETPWSLDGLDAGRLENLLRGITAFVVDVEHFESKRKLSQNRSSTDRVRVEEALRRRGAADDHALADLMHEEDDRR